MRGRHKSGNVSWTGVIQNLRGKIGKLKPYMGAKKRGMTVEIQERKRKLLGFFPSSILDVLEGCKMSQGRLTRILVIGTRQGRGGGGGKALAAF